MPANTRTVSPSDATSIAAWIVRNSCGTRIDPVSDSYVIHRIDWPERLATGRRATSDLLDLDPDQQIPECHSEP